MASPNWKTPNNHDNATFACRSSLSSSPNNFLNKFSNSSSSLNDSSTNNTTAPFREAGIVEKLLASYGFIQCCERQARLFFHYSQFNGNIDHLKLGDPVEFEMTYDKRTGKPIASLVVKISSEAFNSEELSSEPVSGFITTELTNEREGRVAYENRGECFFLPFTKDDIEDGKNIFKSKDRVTFYIATDKSGNLRARHIKLEIPTPQKHQGVICTIKDSFGFIERADVVKEIFFHSSECKDFKDLGLGDDVEFCIQSRNGKEVAVNVQCLTRGTVVFEDVSEEKLRGKIVKTIERSSAHSHNRQQSINSLPGQNDPFPGRISYKKNNSEFEISFGERDIKGEFTLQANDIVYFKIVTDRRDQLKHATAIQLSEESFENSGEHREQGYIASLKEFFGFIKCFNREGTRIYFRINELLDPDVTIKLNDEVEFTVAPDVSSPGRLQAIRIKLIPDGTILKNLISCRSPNSFNKITNGISSFATDNNFNGERLGTNSLENFNKTNEFPLIDFNTELGSGDLNTFDSSELTLNEHLRNIAAKTNSWSEILRQLDFEEKFTNSDLLTIDNGNEQSFSQELLQPVVVNASKRQSDNQNDNNEVRQMKKDEINSELKSVKNGIKYNEKGFIVALKETYGFIEAEDGQKEVFFHYSVFNGNIETVNLGQQVEYCSSFKNSKYTALAVKKANSNSLIDITSFFDIQTEVYTGNVIRTVRTFNPEQAEYPGLIKMICLSNNQNEENDVNEYEFCMLSLVDIHEFIQKGDVVKFQIGISKIDQKEKAVNIKPIRTKFQGVVECIKGNFGFLIYDSPDEGKTNIFFHMSEVKGNTNLQSGDIVEFVIVQSQRSGKYSACNVVKIGESQIVRPERLTRVKVDESGPRVVVLRPPKGPDGSKGFNHRSTCAAVE